jgi:hypothetical protein
MITTQALPAWCCEQGDADARWLRSFPQLVRSERFSGFRIGLNRGFAASFFRKPPMIRRALAKGLLVDIGDAAARGWCTDDHADGFGT